MTKRLLLAMTITVAFALTMQVRATLAVDTIAPSAPIVVELFTSQGCSSCPPADRILSTLAQMENVIALACHVRYWDRPQWKDPMSREYCDMRQHGYSGLRGDKKIYTPQMVVNGLDYFIGSRTEAIKSAFEKAEKKPIRPITVALNDAKTIDITLSDMPNDNYHLWAFGYEAERQENIGGGENTGRAITYTHPVSSYTNLGKWSGMAKSLSFKKPEGPMDGIVILAQRDGYGEIVAAGQLQF